MIKKLAPYTKGYRLLMLFAIACSAGEAVLELTLPQVMSDIVDIGIANGDRGYILMAGLKMVIMALLALGCGVGAAALAAKASMGFGAALRKAEYEQVQRFSFANIERFSTASLVTRLTNDVASVQMTTFMGMRMLVRAPTMLVTALVMALIISTRLSQVFLVVIPLLVIAVVIVIKRVGPFFTSLQGATDQLNLVVQEDLNAIRVVKSFVREAQEKEKFTQRSEKLRSMAERAFGFVVLFMPVMMILMGGTITAVMWIGGHYVWEGTLLSGDLIAFFTYLSEILMSLMMVSVVLMMLTRAIACGKRIAEVLEEKPRITDEQADPALKVEDGSIRFDHVYFKYHDTAEAWNLEDVSFTVPSGATVGILGGTGSAKAVRRERRRGVCGRAQCEGLHHGGAAGWLRHGIAEEHAVLRHHPGEPALGRRERQRSGDRGGLPSGLRRRVHREDAGRIRHLYRTGRHQRLRRAEAAAVHRPSGAAEAEDTDPGRLHQRGGHRHGREDPRRAENGAARHHKAHHRPADHIRYGRRPDTGDGRWAHLRHRHP